MSDQKMSAPDQREMKSAFYERSNITDEERKRLIFFRHFHGHCSACARDDVTTAHLGISGKANVGLCEECISGLTKALKDGPNV